VINLVNQDQSLFVKNFVENPVISNPYSEEVFPPLHLEEWGVSFLELPPRKFRISLLTRVLLDQVIPTFFSAL